MLLKISLVLAFIAIVCLVIRTIILANKLEDKTQWFESILDGVPYMISVTDMDMNWTFVNKAVEKSMGKSRKELIGLNCTTMKTNVCGTENCGINCLRRGINCTSYRESGVGLEIGLQYVYDKKGNKIGHLEAVHDVTALYTASDQQNKMVEYLKDATKQITLISENVSSNSMEMAQNAEQQVQTLQALFDSINAVALHIKSNADNSNSANTISAQVADEMDGENAKMQEMISAMEEIEKSSKEIEKIIKSIDDIAFQTNILALNAAVEAARAGTAGKGFAVVADEVRNLSGKSAAAAGNTSALIENSVKNVKSGTEIANTSAQTLSSIIDKSQKFTLLINQISQASAQDAQQISRVTDGLEDVLKAIQNTSKITEQNAASAEELSSQLSVLNSIITNDKIEGPNKALA